MTQILIATEITAAINKAITDYVPVGTGATTGVSTESTAQMKWRTAGTFSGLWANVSANTVTATSTVAFRDGGASQNQSLSIGASTTGTFQDTTNSDTVAAADLIDLQIATGATGTSITMSALGMLFSPSSSGNTVNKLSCGAGTSVTSLSALYAPLAGQLPSATGTTEANAQFKNKATATLQNLSVSVASNSTTASSTIRTRVGGANGNLSVSIGSGATGQFEDTANSDSLSSGNLVNYQITPGSASAFSLNHVAVDYLTTSGNTHYLGGSDNTYTVSANVTTYQTMAPGILVNATESAVQTLAQLAFTASNLEAHIATNTVTATSTIKFRIDGANGNQVLSIGASTSGYFEDTTNSDSVLTTSNINYQIATGATGSTMGVNNIGFLAAYPTGAVTAIPWFPYYDNLTSPVSNAQTASVFQTIPAIVPPVFPPQPIYNDQVRPNLPVQRDFVFEPVLPLKLPMPWQPQYADLARETPRVKGESFFAPGWPIAQAATPLRWLPQYADKVRPNLPVQRDFVFEPTLALNLPIKWQPVYSDQSRPNLKVQRDFIFEPIFPLNLPLPWLPRYPDSPPPVISAATRTADKVFAISAAPVVLSWLPDYPNQIQLGLQQLPSGAIEPVLALNLSMPWQPLYADQVRPNLKVQRDFVFSCVPPLNTPLQWLPSYPDLYREPPRVKGESFFAPKSQLSVKLLWLPEYPDMVWRVTAQDTNQVSRFQPLAPVSVIPWFPSYPALVPGLPLPALASLFAPIIFSQTPTPPPSGRIINLQLDGRTISLTSVGRVVSVSNQGRIL